MPPRLSAGLRLPVLLVAVLCAGNAALVPAAAAASRPAAPRPVDKAALSLSTVSSPRPDLVTGDRVLIRLSSGSAVDAGSLRITRGTLDVTPAFVAQADGSRLGLLTGLTEGTTTVRAQGSARGRTVKTSMVVDDHPGSGPVFSGPQQQPFRCRTEDSGLAASTSPTCDAPRTVSFRTLDIARQSVRLRFEKGVVNRSVYRIVAPAEPDDREPDPTGSDPAWNGRLIFTFGGGCNSGYQQGAVDDALDPAEQGFLAAGYAIATSTLNVLGTNCNTVVSAETAMMVKERFVTTYGPVTHTIGWGSSGGSIQQLAIADQYPGILDGVIAAQTFPEAVGPVLATAADCRLLVGLLGSDRSSRARGGQTDSAAEASRAAVTGFARSQSCRSWSGLFSPLLQATASCNPWVDQDAIWDPDTNPGGVQCSAAAQYRTQLGTDADTGFANGFFDNVGVQYGLEALRQGLITPTQFASLNARIGGLDYRGDATPARTRAATAGLSALYADDLITSGTQGLTGTPVIDLRAYVDDDPRGEIHTSAWSATVRARMTAAGDAGGLVSLRTAAASPAQLSFVVGQMNRWLDTLAAGDRTRSPQQQVAAARPAHLVDGCFLDDDAAVTPEDPSAATGPCASAYPVHGTPRTAAGQPAAMTTLACALTPLDRDAYPGVTFTDDDWALLEHAFPTGVCDYTRPGIGEDTPRRGPWIDYSAR